MCICVTRVTRKHACDPIQDQTCLESNRTPPICCTPSLSSLDAFIHFRRVSSPSMGASQKLDKTTFWTGPVSGFLLQHHAVNLLLHPYSSGLTESQDFHCYHQSVPPGPLRRSVCMRVLHEPHMIALWPGWSNRPRSRGPRGRAKCRHIGPSSLSPHPQAYSPRTAPTGPESSGLRDGYGHVALR